MKTKFTLKSIELRDYDKTHTCEIQKVLDSQKIIVNVTPPFPGHYYGHINDLEQLVLTPRYEGTTITPKISEWPFYVNICLPDDGGSWENGPYRIKDIGVLEKQ